MQTMYEINPAKVEASAFMVSAFDRNMNITVWNRAMEKKFGILAKNAVGKKLTDLFAFENDFGLKVLRDAVNEKKTFYFPNLPYQLRSGCYAQLVLSANDQVFVISCDVAPDETVPRHVLYDAVL